MPLETHRRSSIRLPSDMVLTARSMVAFATRLTTAEVADLIEALIAQLDVRTGDADLEPEPEMCRA